MKLEYRLKGKVQKSFILRGMTFYIGENFDFVVYENELSFVKERCTISEIIDLNKKVEPAPKAILEEETDKKDYNEEVKEGTDVKLQRNTRTYKGNNSRKL